MAVFMDDLKLFCVHVNTMGEAIQIALQEEYSHRQTPTPTPVWQGHNALTGAVQGGPAARTGLVPMELDVGSSGTCNVLALREGKGSALPNLGAQGASEATTQEPGEDLSPHGRSADGARHGGLAPESLGALETRKSSGGLLVVHASVREIPSES
ncbi:LOW QUALITY PROTEIN: Gag protein [Phytophthora palmivora]|uniref:Gag protein n=1 Tax=Phytophthora palmivora TaxID=4796 RepID=A0A2P4XYC8_9STRA|nr:LOW QUALITY PROTEIN: Gag protein [Phytophthora palmivora]